MVGRPSELDLLKQWYKYNSYVRKKYLAAIFDKFPEEERYKDRGASFPSVVDIFVHILDAYRWWFICVYEDRVSERVRLRGKNYSRDELVTEEKKLDELLRAFLNRLGLADLQKWVPYRDGEEFRQPNSGTCFGTWSKKSSNIEASLTLSFGRWILTPR